MEEKEVEINTLEQKREEFKERIKEFKEDIAHNFINESVLPPWQNYNAVMKFKSVRRAIRRGKVDLYTGLIFPDRPFNNRRNTKGRGVNKLRKGIYEQYKRAV